MSSGYCDPSGGVDYIRNYINDKNSIPNTLIDRFIGQSAIDIANKLGYCTFRSSIEIVKGTGTYSLDSAVKDMQRITWNGFKMEPKSQKQLSMLSPVYRTSTSRPFYYSIGSDGYLVLRVFPVPSLNLHQVNDELLNTEDGIGNGLIVSATQNSDEFPRNITYPFPAYIGLKLIKDYVLWRCFEVDGAGQDLKASSYFEQKYNSKVEFYKDIVMKTFLPTTRQLSDSMIQKPYRMAYPILPPNFGPVVGE